MAAPTTSSGMAAPTTSSGGTDTANGMNGEEVVRQGSALDHFAESEELQSLIAGLPLVCLELRSREKSAERFTSILDKYQEQPHLLDPYLEGLINQLFLLTEQNSHPIIKQQAFRYLYLISKVRSSKVMVRWFPHEVSNFDPVLTLLQQQDPRDYETWETRYILLIWLSFLVMIPFDLSRMDGSGCGQSTVDRVFAIAKLYIGVTDKCSDGAALLMARLVTRQDVKTVKLEEYVGWALGIVDTGSRQDPMLLSGVLFSLCLTFKHGKREDVVDVALKLLPKLTNGSLVSSSNTHLRKLHVKMVKWIGVTLLPPRVAKWRYERGGRSLEDALAIPNAALSAQQDAMEEEGEGYEIPSEIEEVLELLLLALKDKDTIVRWTAAKGVGKVTGRLPMELADEVLQSLLQLFNSREDDGAWHGGCLAMAELGRRGLLLPDRLIDVVPVVLQALAYDERRGACSVGAHVRDAGCYVCWSFARAYHPDHLKPYVSDIASGLVVAMLFDREVNCRRAASAAFQENVGRQGTFPHGIAILTAADYFAVGNISNAYLNVSVQVAKFPEYTKPLIQHLQQHKLLHWDSNVREVAARGLHQLTSLDPLYIKDNVLPSLVPLVTSPDFCLRHGALHAVAEVSHALYTVARRKGRVFEEYVGSDTIQALLQISSRLQKANVFRGAVGEIMRPAALKFIKLMCRCKLPVSDESVLDTWQDVVKDNLSHTEEHIRENAVSALSGLCVSYYSIDGQSIQAAQEQLIPAYTAQLLSHSHFTRMGFSLALGVFPRPLLAGHLREVLDPLVHSCSDMGNWLPKFAEARRDALRSITRLCSTVGVSSCDPSLSGAEVEAVFDGFCCCLHDYTMDSRGDIGASVREAAMTGLSSLLTALAAEGGHLLSPQTVSRAVCGLVQQSNEKIDRTRAIACEALMGVVFHEPAIPHIPCHAELKQLFKDAMASSINWSSPHLTFPLTVQLLNFPIYLPPTLLGVLVSVGGLTESTVRHSSAALLSYLRGVSADVVTLDPFAKAILLILQEYAQDSRVVLPLMKTMDLLLSNGVFDVFNSPDQHSFPKDFLDLLNQTLKSCRDPIMLLSSINVFCGLLQFPSTQHSALNKIMLLLCHNFPKIRKSTADQFYVTLLTFDEVVDAAVMDEVMSCLSDTAWDDAIDGVRERRNALCHLLQLPIPKLVKSSKKKSAAASNDLDSYKDLVDRAGY